MKEGKYSARIISVGPEAKISLCKCPEAKKPYAIRMERTSEGWACTWAFTIEEKTAKREGYDTTVLIGELTNTNDYNGCPYCGMKHFIICSNCHHLNCLISDTPVFTCEWCGNKGELCDYEGDGIVSGGDLA